MNPSPPCIFFLSEVLRAHSSGGGGPRAKVAIDFMVQVRLDENAEFIEAG